MVSMLYLPGRVIAKTKEEAITKIVDHITRIGFLAVEPIKPYPCKVQYRPDETWWEHYTNVQKVEAVECLTRQSITGDLEL